MDTIIKRLMEARKASKVDTIADAADEIRYAVAGKAREYMRKEGFPEDEIKDYLYVDAELYDDSLVIVVRAELDYEGMEALCRAMNPIVAQYDKDAYFDMEEPGIASAFLRKDLPLGEGVYYPYDHSDRDNSEYHKAEKRDEESHPYVGRKVRWSEDNRTYKVTGAYDDSRGTIVRCGDITMRPDEYKLLEDSQHDEDLLEESTGWDYWEMPKEYDGPWVQDHFSRDYGNGIIGLIYPPYEASRSWLSSMTHQDYIAELYEYTTGREIDLKHFKKMKDARAWLDGLASDTLSSKEEVKESQYLSSFSKDVMRAVNDEAPSALHWKDGDKIKHTKTGYVAVFRGYEKNPITGVYKVVLELDNEDTGKLETYKYPLKYLQREIKNGVLVKVD